MSATDTKETPTPRVDKQLQIQADDGFYSGIADVNSVNGVPADFARTIENDLTAVTAQRDRALGLLDRFKNYLAMMVYDTGSNGKLHCFSCGVCQQENHAPDCSVNKLLSEYEVLRKGKR